MKNAMLVVIAVGAGAWLLLNYNGTILTPRSLTRWLPIMTSRNGLALGLVVASMLILLVWAGFRRPGR
jgi:fructose-specific phosphotransferase system IIC component